MSHSIAFRNRTDTGFTMVELLVVIVILAILCVAAIPAFSVWLPNYRLRSSAQDLFSNLQATKLRAIRQNAATGVSFYAGPDRYLYTGAGVDRTVNLSTYEHGTNFDGPAGQTFDVNYLSFDVRGFSNGGYAYLSNADHTAYYRVGALTTGVVTLRKWNGSAWE